MNTQKDAQGRESGVWERLKVISVITDAVVRIADLVLHR